MTTRSSLKCHLTGITLEPAEAVQVPEGVEHYIFHAEWKNSSSKIVGEASDAEKSDFIKVEWNRVLTHILCSPNITVLNYFRFLISWLLIVDPASSLRLLRESSLKCSSVNELQHFTFFFQACLRIIVCSTKFSQIISEIEDISPRIDIRFLLYNEDN
jgi:hypothetical protein